MPEPLPAGEEVLWQGKPTWRGMALRVFHVRAIAAYFCILALWRGASGIADGEGAQASAIGVAWLILLGAAALGVLALMSWLIARSTNYTITSRRIVIQFGVALPMTLNIPFRVVATAALKPYADGTGDIPVSIIGDDRIAYLVLWPHARPWRAARAEPMLRAVPDARRVADVLTGALVAATNGGSVAARSGEEVLAARSAERAVAAA